MAKRKQYALPTSDELMDQTTQFSEVFALDNVTQLRKAVDQVVYGEAETSASGDDVARAHTIEVLATLGQMGILTEMDLDEARKSYL
ncbi:hypothetical protein [Spirosoma flavum]|uniref:Uncharacterized protein n=1 Tax=Spirosoma flavum TaxID=2048557 RepID=A0ABW6AW50_9BACT